VKLIAGLGNPGAAYGLTRHNIGFMALDRIAAETGITLQKDNFDALIGRASWCGQDILLAKPMTFMNRSGAEIKAIADTFTLQSGDIYILHDDMDIPFGVIRLKTRGGSGGHRGIESIKEHLSTDEFVRLRIGIGRPPETFSGPEYVLDIFSDTELQEIHSITGLVVQCMNMLLTQGIPAAMNKFHAKGKRTEQNSIEPAQE
jgi:peptidyl-tRNA hydrolase, PTH1 family